MIRRTTRKMKTRVGCERESFPVDYSMKMVLCVRKDLPMTKGKACAQCCHAAVGAVGRARRHTKGMPHLCCIDSRYIQGVVPKWLQEGGSFLP